MTPAQGGIPRPPVLRELRPAFVGLPALCPALERELLEHRRLVFLAHRRVARSTHSPGTWQPQVLVQEMSNDCSRK